MKNQNKEKVLIKADLQFTYTVDMTEFNQRYIKVDEVESAKKEYLKSQLPLDDSIKAIFKKLEEELSALGLECQQNIVAASTYFPELEFLSLLKAKCLGNLMNAVGGGGVPKD